MYSTIFQVSTAGVVQIALFWI